MKRPLDPNHRELLTDGLRPEPGYVVDAAVATTFSVDLEALLLAPLSFAMFDSDTTDDELEPVALLSALKSYAERIAVYSDAAHIRASGADGRLFILLEQIVHPVVSPGGGAFHPKVWVLRFRREDGAVRHRILVLTRNHTFDRSWDLVVRIDESEDGGQPIGRQVADFLDQLDGLSESAITRDVARSVRRARFSPPDGFDSMAFHAIGFGGADPLAGVKGRRLCIVSPFLSSRRLSFLSKAAPEAHIISTPVELARLGGRALEQFEPPLCIHEEADPDDLESDTSRSGGLHAKLYVFDREDSSQSTWFVGSANATISSTERNVETLLELTGPTSRTGVKRLLRQPDTGEINLRSLLREFVPENDGELTDSAAADEHRIEKIARDLATCRPTLKVTTAESGYQLALHIASRPKGLKPEDQIKVRLITAAGRSGSSAGRQEVDFASTPRATLTATSSSQITSFIEFTITSGAPAGERSAPKSFVAVAELHGAPEDRHERLLLDLIPDARRFRLLLFLLLASADPDGRAAEQARTLIGGLTGGRDEGHGDLEIPLFESLARAYAREPERLNQVAELVATLKNTEEGCERLPDDFEEMWAAFAMAARTP